MKKWELMVFWKKVKVKSEKTFGWWENFTNGEVPEQELISRKSFEELNTKLSLLFEKQRTKMR